MNSRRDFLMSFMCRVLEENMVITVEPGCYFNPALLKPAMKGDDQRRRFLVSNKIQENMVCPAHLQNLVACKFTEKTTLTTQANSLRLDCHVARLCKHASKTALASWYLTWGHWQKVNKVSKSDQACA